jgi:anti-sigma regulatory factor (Ser/Thr protein kinase)
MIIRVTDPSHAGEARRQALIVADQVKLGERERGALAIAVTEIATNLVKHAGSGSIVIDAMQQNGNRGVRVLGLDKGPGIRDISAALSDGHSTAGTAGNGLGAIKRLSDDFDIHSSPGMGTAVLADFWFNRKAPLLPVEVGVISIAIKGEDVCGDGWGAKKTAESMALMVVDGLGHGILAAEAAREAERVFSESRTASPAPILQDVHDSLKKTRGAAMAVASLHFERGLVSFAGVGNIGASIVNPESSRGMASHNGIVGHQLHRVQEFTFPWNDTSLLIMHSDGLNTRWDLKPYLGVWSKHPALIAGLLYRDFSRERDDVTVLVAKGQPQNAGLS